MIPTSFSAIRIILQKRMQIAPDLALNFLINDTYANLLLMVLILATV